MKKLPKRFAEAPRVKISRILIEELEKWESTEKVTDKEFYRLVDRLAKVKSVLNKEIK